MADDAPLFQSVTGLATTDDLAAAFQEDLDRKAGKPPAGVGPDDPYSAALAAVATCLLNGGSPDEACRLLDESGADEAERRCLIHAVMLDSDAAVTGVTRHDERMLEHLVAAAGKGDRASAAVSVEIVEWHDRQGLPIPTPLANLARRGRGQPRRRGMLRLNLVAAMNTASSYGFAPTRSPGTDDPCGCSIIVTALGLPDDDDRTMETRVRDAWRQELRNGRGILL